jgi:hypothetical protein
VSVGHPGTERPLKADGIKINEVADGYVVYHAALDRVHYLNHTAVIVLELCTGENDAAAIAGFVQRAYELPEHPAAEVAACLDRLLHVGLVK